MQEVTSILQRMRELAIQSASDTNSDADREFLQNEIDQLSTELDRIAQQRNIMELMCSTVHMRTKFFKSAQTLVRR